jgi:hypothetical protein
MCKILLSLGFVFMTISCHSGQPAAGPSEDAPRKLSFHCSPNSTTVKVPQDFATITEALVKNTPDATSTTSPVQPMPQLTIQVAYTKDGYRLKQELSVERPCTDIIGISDSGKKPILRREEFGEYEQPVVKIAASNVLFKGFEIVGKFTSQANSDSSGVLVLIRKEETQIAGYSNISIEDNDIHTIGYKYPQPDAATKCWKNDNYICGGAHGIEIKSNTSHPIEKVIVRGNKIHDLHVGQSEALTISNNVYDFLVEQNEIYDVDNIGIDIAGFQDDNIPFAASKGRVVSNRIYKSNAKDNPGQKRTYPYIAGIYVDGGHGLDLQENPVLIERNVIYDYGFGIEIGSEKSGHKVDNIIAQNNLIFGNWIVGIGVGHDDDDQQSYVENCLVRNNTLYDDKLMVEEDRGELRLLKHERASQPLGNIRYENNLIAVTTTDRCLIHADIKPLLAKFDVAFLGNLFVGKQSKFWDCKKDFEQFNSMVEITLQNNETKSEFPFKKQLPGDPKLIVDAIRNGNIKEYFQPKAFAVGKGIAW